AAASSLTPLALGGEPPLRGGGTAPRSHRRARACPRTPAPAGADARAGALPDRSGAQTGLVEGLLRLRRQSLRRPVARAGSRGKARDRRGPDAVQSRPPALRSDAYSSAGGRPPAPRRLRAPSAARVDRVAA